MKIKMFALITLFALLVFLMLAVGSCQIIDNLVLGKIEKPVEETEVNEQNEPETLSEEDAAIKDATKEYQIAYLEVGIDKNSTHFEHRVANIYAVRIDGTDKKLIYSDINDKYALNAVYSISPDGTKILCGISDDARGVYSALCYVDIETGNLIKLIEFDFSENEEVSESIYGNPIWSNNSDKIAYETIINPYTDNYKDGGIQLIDIKSGAVEKLNIDMDEQSNEGNIFFYPVFFFPDDAKIIAISHPYFPKIEQGKILDYYTKNESLSVIDIESGKFKEILNTSQFEGIEAEIISSFDNFNIFKDTGLLVFQVLGDFEEDGDIWLYDIAEDKLTKLTDDNDLREQQPSILDVQGLDKKVAFVGVGRYGTIAENTRSGNIYIIDNLENMETINCKAEGLKPVFSPDGKYLAFMYLEYDENYDYIENYQIKTFEIESGELGVALTYKEITDLIGWIKVE